MIPLKISASKVRKLMESAGSYRPESIRTAFVGRKLGGYGEARVAPSKTHVEQVGEGYIFFWSVRKIEERRDSGV